MASPLDPATLVYDLRSALDAQVSPDGARILYGLSSADRRSGQTVIHLWSCAADGSDQRQLTFAGELNLHARWSPDGSLIAFVSDRGAKAEGERAIHLLPAAGGEPRELLRRSSEIADMAWSADGSRLAFTARVDPEEPAEELVPKNGKDRGATAPRVRVTRRDDYKFDGHGYLGDARLQVFAVGVDGGEARQLTKAAFDHDHPAWSPDGGRLAARRARQGIFSQLAIVEVESERETMIGPEVGSVGVWAWSPGGDRILLACDPGSTAQFDLAIYEVATASLRTLRDDLEMQPDAGYPGAQPPSPPVWLDDRRVLLHAFRAGASGLYEVDVETGAIAHLAGWSAIHSGLSVDSGHRLAVQVRNGFDAAGEISAFNLETVAGGAVVRPNRDLLLEHPPAQPERLAIQRGDLEIEAWLLKPPGLDQSRRHPLVLDVHGGPHGYHGHLFNPVQQCLATHGFLVLAVNPRGSSTYGRDFASRVRRDWGGEDYLDLMAAVDEACRLPYVDPDRTAIYGYSYGGFMTSWTIGHSDRFAAAVCGAPCFDLESFWGTSDIADAWGDLQFGGPPSEIPAWYRDHSPSTFAHRATTPTLIIHGEADERCPIGQGEQMFSALRRAGCEVEFARYPGQYHLFLRSGPPEHREDYLARVLSWFQAHLE